MDLVTDGSVHSSAEPPQVIRTDAYLELNHRIANSLQLVATFLRLQEREVVDVYAKEAIRTAATRVSAIGLVQRAILYIAGSEIEFAPFLRAFCTDVSVATGMTISLSTDNICLPTSAVENLAIVVNELVINAAKYAYGGSAGKIDISCRRLGHRSLIISVADQGRGLPEGLDVSSSLGVGMTIVRAALQALEGSLTFENGIGTKATLRIPLRSRRHNGRLQF